MYCGFEQPYQRTNNTNLNLRRTQEDAQPKQEETKPTQTADTSLDLEFWQSVKDSDDPGYVPGLSSGIPRGYICPLAKVKLKQLSGTTDVVASAIPDLNYGRYHALVIGNNDYDYLSDLKTAINDAEGVASLLKEDYGFEVSLLKNATRAETVKALSGFRKTVSANDSLLIYYAGHGHLDEAADEGYWLPVDSSPDDPSNWLQNGTDSCSNPSDGCQARHDCGGLLFLWHFNSGD